MARTALEACTRQQPMPFIQTTDPDLLKPSGCFVTLRKRGRLRGCVGTLKSERPLFEEVARMTKTAAVQDFRFCPVESEELPHIEIEISILSPLERIHSWEEIEAGRHGIYLMWRNKSGAFLPEVATEMNWTAEELVKKCAYEKAGIPESAWSETELYRFTTEKISE